MRPPRGFEAEQPAIAAELRAWAEDGLIAPVSDHSVVDEVVANVLRAIREQMPTVESDRHFECRFCGWEGELPEGAYSEDCPVCK